jgi:alkyl sulfatase BDS1-like metallo-beta-lactamase superfamily hydrolase
VLNHVIMADPQHAPARALLADAYEQLGYQAESAPWRNFYLCGALELREGVPASSPARVHPGMADNMPIEDLLKAMAVRLMLGRVTAAELLDRTAQCEPS